MIGNLRTFRVVLSVIGLALSWSIESRAQTQIEVRLDNNSPTGGVYLTPVWVGFHNGSFDSYDGGAASAPELERLAEDGNAGPLSSVFAADGTLVPTGATQAGTRVQGGLGAAPIGPGGFATALFDIDAAGANQYLSYASMVLASNDYFVANGNPFAIDLSSLAVAPIGTSFSLNIGEVGSVNDAGTEINDFATSAGNGLFPGLGGGQSGPNEGADQGGVIANVVGDPFAGFLNAPGGFDFGPLNFNDSALYTDGIGTITITVVPEPASWSLGLLACLGLWRRGRRVM